MRLIITVTTIERQLILLLPLNQSIFTIPYFYRTPSKRVSFAQSINTIPTVRLPYLSFSLDSGTVERDDERRGNVTLGAEAKYNFAHSIFMISISITYRTFPF